MALFWRLQMRRGFAIIKRKRTTATKVVASNEQLGYIALPTLSEPQGRLFLFCRELSLSPYLSLNFRFFPSTRSGRAGPLLSGQQKVGKDWPKRAAPPLGFPLCGRAGAACGRNSRAKKGYKIGGWRNPPPLRGRSFRAGFAWASLQKPFRTRSQAHSRRDGKKKAALANAPRVCYN